MRADACHAAHSLQINPATQPAPHMHAPASHNRLLFGDHASAGNDEPPFDIFNEDPESLRIRLGRKRRKAP